MAALQRRRQPLDVAEGERGDDSADGEAAGATGPGQLEGAQPLERPAERRVLAQPVAETEGPSAFGQVQVEAVLVDLETVGEAPQSHVVDGPMIPSQ